MLPLAFTMMIHNYDVVVTMSRELHTSGYGVRLFLDAEGDPDSSQNRTDEHMRLPLPLPLSMRLEQSLHSHETSVNRGGGPSISHVPVEEGCDLGVGVEAVL